MTIYYLCDGRLSCNHSEDCYKNGGSCAHTIVESHSIVKNYPEFADTYFTPDGADAVECIDPRAFMRTFMADNPTPDLTRLATV